MDIIMGLVLLFIVSCFSAWIAWEPQLIKSPTTGDLILFYNSKEKHRNHRKWIIILKGNGIS